MLNALTLGFAVGFIFAMILLVPIIRHAEREADRWFHETLDWLDRYAEMRRKTLKDDKDPGQRGFLNNPDWWKEQ